ncbi:translation initiation factor IF-3 [Paenibacillus sp. UNCCL117]|uniref:translation initiation factor IF-3 n=1 Tax=unclassified Paenibacillus TaxID=185978 RepID=UPI00087E9B5F|nr:MULTISPECIES: translation initiation factor IF-3 [unclassified Paenibacillus]SDC91409.1 translation initiation factor IF-3 [Paenibacillus sp. cl123]SFW29068.1 translation initiation factor IF-3 [Paenibacillus sp. UNCCL117]
MIKNEQIKASEVQLTGMDGEDLGIMPKAEALAMARRLKVDLVCMSLLSSPPPCRLIGAAAARESAQQARKLERPAKIKEIRLTPGIEDHDLDTKRQQAERLLKSGDSALFVVHLQGKADGERAKTLLEELTQSLRAVGRRKSGIQVSGKQAAVQLDPL